MKRSRTSSQSSKAQKNSDSQPRDLRKAISEKTMALARKIAAEYSVLLRPSDEHGFSGTCLEYPMVLVHGSTATQCAKKLREAVAIGVAVMLDAGEAPPLPASGERRNQQVNIRLTSEEKLMLEEAARRRGYRGLSDFMRAAAMSQTRRSA